MTLHDTSSTPRSETFCGHCRLSDWGVIDAQGEDAAQFLHGQLTQDVLLLAVGQARLAAFCSAKGRMQASFWLLKRSADSVLLIMPKALIARTVKRLSMFVLRSKVQLRDAGDAWSLWGEVAPSAPASPAPASVETVEGGYLLTIHPALGHDRKLCILQADGPVPARPELSAPVWDWLEVRSAVGFVTEATFEAFVPQMLNYESLGGVNFKKGCYPGQEVVARSQFRGTLKRRAALWHGSDATPCPAGTELFAPDDSSQPCATVVASAPCPDGQGQDLLVSGTLEGMAQGRLLHADHPAGFTPLPLPYPLLEDI